MKWFKMVKWLILLIILLLYYGLFLIANFTNQTSERQ